MGENKLENVEANASRQPPENAQAEANADRHILSDKQKVERKSLRSGGRSGISDAFGKPVLLDSSEDNLDKSMAFLSEHSLDSKPAHGAQTETDAHGRIAKITNDGKPSLEVKYGPDGQPSEIKDRDGVTRNNGDGTWTRQNKEGKVVETGRADAILMPDGEIHLVGDRGKGSTWHTDGSKSETYGKSEVRRDPDGLVTRVTYPDGRTLDATYDADRKLVKLKDKDGSTLEKDGDSWVLKDAQGKEIDRPTKVELSGNGDRTLTRGTWMVKTHPDGGKSEYNDAGTLVRRDAEGKVTDMRYPTTRFRKDGDEVQILYGDDKKPYFVSQPDGSFYEKKDGAWTHIGTNGKKIEDIKDVEIKEDGETKVTDMHDNTSTRRADGSMTEIRKGESRTEFNARGQVTEIAYEPPERGTIKPTYDKDHNLVSVKDVDGTELRPSEGGWKRYRVEQGKEDRVVGELNDVSFTKDGHLRTVKTNGEIFIRDGSDATTEHRHEGTKITRNNDNTRVTVEYANGDRAQVKREDLGPGEHYQPTDITFGNHHLVRQNDGKWIEFDPSGKRVTEWYPVYVTESGEIEMTTKEGETKVKTASGKIHWKTTDEPRRSFSSL